VVALTRWVPPVGRRRRRGRRGRGGARSDGVGAVTVKVYVTPLVRPVTVQVVAPVVVQVKPPGVEVTVYAVMGRPPVEEGAVQWMTDWPLAFEVAVTAVGAPGTDAGTMAPEAAEATLVPEPLVALTVNV